MSLVLLIGFHLYVTPGPLPRFIAPVILLFAQIRRFHDLGRSAWWAAGLVVAEIAVMGGATAVVEQEPAETLAGFVYLAALVVLGVLPGDRTSNRFGPPPGHADMRTSSANLRLDETP